MKPQGDATKFVSTAEIHFRFETIDSQASGSTREATGLVVVASRSGMTLSRYCKSELTTGIGDD
jgi:hypothetical protein